MAEYRNTPYDGSKKIRFEALVKRWWDLQDSVRIRSLECADDPLGSTGYYVRQFKVQGSSERPVVVEEYSLDIQLLRELRSLEKEIAVRCGEWKNGASTGALGFDVNVVRNPMFDIKYEDFYQRVFGLLSPAQVQEFHVKLEALTAKAAENPIASGELKTRPVDRNCRLAVLAERRNILLAAIRIRGMEFADDPVAKTGYYSRRVKDQGNCGGPVFVHEYSLDTQLLDEIDAIDKQIAIEREEWGPFNHPAVFETPPEESKEDAQSILFSLLTDEQNRESLLMELELWSELLNPQDGKGFEAYVDHLVDSARKLRSNDDNVRRL